jgi:pimeloyl-ACP methyl ester carboxylesterase
VRRAPRVLVLVAALLSACAVAPQEAGLAREGGLAPLMLEGRGFQHAAYARVTDGDALLTVFIEGDGSPWTHGGRRVARAPTSRNLVALQLAAQTPGSVLYLGRPCYGLAHPDPACTPRWWTSDRYASEVVMSLASAASGFREAHRLGRMLLVGHSGGGTLAVLLARRLAGLAGVVSIAGNLDPDEWTREHRYLPLTGLNPALEPSVALELPQWYLIGGRDKTVTEAMAARYLERVPPARIWHYPQLDHSCCWRSVWPPVYASVLQELAGAAATSPR